MIHVAQIPFRSSYINLPNNQQKHLATYATLDPTRKQWFQPIVRVACNSSSSIQWLYNGALKFDDANEVAHPISRALNFADFRLPPAHAIVFTVY